MKIKTKISLWITGAGVLVSLIFSLIVFYEMSEQIWRQLDHELKATIRNVYSMVKDNETGNRGEAPLNPGFFLDQNLYWVKVWQENKLIYSSKLAKIIDLPVDFQQKKATSGIIIPKTTINLHQDSWNEVTFRIRRIKIPGTGNSPGYQIQAAIPMEKLDEEIKEVALIILLGLMLSCILFLSISYFLAERILAPIRHITDMAKEINSKDLAARIPLNVNRDELYELSFALNQMLDRLQYSFKHQKEFIANAAHELNTPIANMRLFVEQGINNHELPEPFRNDLIRQHEILLRSGRLLHNLMILSNLELKQTIKPNFFDFKELIISVIADFQPLFEVKKIPLTTKMPESLITWGDYEQLRRVVVNLVENAIKYNSPGAKIKIELKKIGHNLVLEISNGSDPIPEDEIEQLFDQFYRIEKSRSQEYGGCGLGLTIVKEIIQLHGGKIQVKNEPPKKIRVIVQLPDNH